MFISYDEKMKEIQEAEKPKGINEKTKKKPANLVKKADTSKTPRSAKVAVLYLAKRQHTYEYSNKPMLVIPDNTKVIPKIVGETRHYPPANKE